MRIAILTQYYPPEIGAAQCRLSDLARRLVERGHVVQVLTALPSYPGHEVMPAYRGHRMVLEEINGVPVARVSLYVPRRKTFGRRLLNYISFAVHAAYRGPELLDPPDFVMTESPPLFLGLTGAYLAWCWGAKFVFNVSDLWPDSAIELGFLSMGPPARAARTLEQWCYRRADLITGQSEGIVRSISSRNPEKTVALLPNGVDLETWAVSPRRDGCRAEFGWSSHDFVVGYAGLHGHAQALHQILAAAALLQKQSHIRFVFFGDGPCKDSLIRMAAAQQLSNITFHPCQPHERMPELLAAVDTGLVPLAKGSFFEGARPSKLFEVMASGKPVVLAGSGESEQLVLQAQCGLVVPPESPETLAAAVERLASDPALCSALGASGRRFVTEHFDREGIATRFEDLLCASHRSALTVPTTAA